MSSSSSEDEAITEEDNYGLKMKNNSEGTNLRMPYWVYGHNLPLSFWKNELEEKKLKNVGIMFQ